MPDGALHEDVRSSPGRDLPRADRAEAFRVAMQEATAPCRVDLRGPADQLHARMHLWRYGRTAHPPVPGGLRDDPARVAAGRHRLPCYAAMAAVPAVAQPGGSGRAVSPPRARR